MSYTTSFFALATGLIGAAASAQTLMVTSDANSGEGSFRAALTAAAEVETPIIRFEGVREIVIDTPLVYTGQSALKVYGSGQLVKTDANITLFEVAQSADVFIGSVHFHGPGGWSISNRADTDGPAGKGIFVNVPDSAEGVVQLQLMDVTVKGVGNHGIHISDCTLADACGSGGGGAGQGSAASILAILTGVTIEDAGNGKFDADGLRIDERGPGDIAVQLANNTFTGVGADGVELDEGQDGDVIVSGSTVTFTNNGNYCDPDIVGPFMPDADEGEFEAGQRAEADIPGPVTGSPDDGCIEREVDLFDDGTVEAYEFGIDLDDGFDIDEAGEGSIIVQAGMFEVIDNRDEGFDFDEEDGGDIRFDFSNSHARGNTDDGFKMTEEDEGAVTGKMVFMSARDNGGKGFVFESEDDGSLEILAASVETANNDDSDDTGIEAVNEGSVEGVLVLETSTIADGIDVDGVKLVQK